MNAEEQSKKAELFHSRCGEVLRKAQHVESTLDFIIPNYFCRPQDYKTFLLSDSVILGLSFERKTQVFKEICTREKIEKGRLKKVMDAINFVKSVRNKVAHFESCIQDPVTGEISLWSPKSYRFKKDSIELTEELLKKVEENRLFAIRQMTDIYLEHMDPNRKLHVEVIQ